MTKSIHSLESLTINDVEQWIQIQANDTSQPVLLILHGGPGYAMMPLFHHHNADLEDDFVVVNWDQRGAGRSYSRSIPCSSMTLRQLLDDLHKLTLYLEERFQQKTINILGHSFGTVLGLLAASKHPKHYAAYVGVGQVVGIAANEIAMYEWTVCQAESSHNERAIKELQMIGHPDKNGDYPGEGPDGEEASDTSERWMGAFGGELYGHKDGSKKIDDWLLEQPVYSGHWTDRWVAGYEFSQQLFNDPEVSGLDFSASLKEITIPAFFLQGHHDYDTPWPLVEKYVSTFVAPRTELVWFDRSSHFPFYEQPKLFNEHLLRVLKGKT